MKRVKEKYWLVNCKIFEINTLCYVFIQQFIGLKYNEKKCHDQIGSALQRGFINTPIKLVRFRPFNDLPYVHMACEQTWQLALYFMTFCSTTILQFRDLKAPLKSNRWELTSIDVTCIQQENMCSTLNQRYCDSYTTFPKWIDLPRIFI